ncbi:hypothetical protein, partial [Pseudoclavibacter helvolus]|uniref:hypothetical protein n=1 Tax=Pseudoclavibacter helvolus TaxID=255205 RepID=UPI003736B29B
IRLDQDQRRDPRESEPSTNFRNATLGIGVAIAARRNQAWERDQEAQRVAEALRLGSLMPVAKHTSF